MISSYQDRADEVLPFRRPTSSWFLNLEVVKLSGLGQDINDFSKRYHHNTNPAADTEPLDDGELTAYARRALNFVGALPQT